ncbi:hypothetical protein IF2G_08296 [Cordyceps javanica]|nr:hypothetical protein IF2G_08296 [Cordyceps javanica]
MGFQSTSDGGVANTWGGDSASPLVPTGHARGRAATNLRYKKKKDPFAHGRGAILPGFDEQGRRGVGQAAHSQVPHCHEKAVLCERGREIDGSGTGVQWHNGLLMMMMLMMMRIGARPLLGPAVMAA